MIQPDNFVTIQGWMITELGLKGNNLLIYAIIYGFSQDGQTEFTGSLAYLQEWTKATKPTVIKALQELVSAGYVSKREIEVANHIKRCCYSALPPVKNFNWGRQDILHGQSSFLTDSCKESLPNNNRDINIDKDRNISLSEADFESFWAIYPKKVGKSYAKTCFRKIKGVPLSVILQAVEDQKRSSQWRQNNGQYIPNPATWLNQGRWQDQLSEAATYNYGDGREWYE